MTDWCWLPWPGRGRSNSQVSRRRVVARMEEENLMETIETILRVYFRIRQHSYKPGQKETSISNPFLCAVDFLEDTLAEISKLAAYWQYFLFGAYCMLY